MKLKVIQGNFAVCQLYSATDADVSLPFTFLSVTDEEISLVCKAEDVPRNVKTADLSWRMFRIEGVLDFSLIGILSRISSVLAQAGVGIFAVSTFNTDYILTKAENFDRAKKALLENGYEIE